MLAGRIIDLLDEGLIRGRDRQKRVRLEGESGIEQAHSGHSVGAVQRQRIKCPEQARVDPKETGMCIVDVRKITKPISSPIRNAYIDFSKMTASLVAVVTDVVRDGRRVVGYGFNSNGRYGQGGLIRERFRDRILEAAPESLLDESGDNLDPHKIWATMMMNEKPGGHGERSVAVDTLDMAVWDAVAKIADKPLFRLLAERHKRQANPRVFVYAAGGSYYPGKECTALRAEMRSYLDRGYNVVKMKIGGATIDAGLFGAGHEAF